MKKLFRLLILIPVFTFAQDKDNYLSVSGGFDLRSATLGSDYTDGTQTLNFTTHFAMVARNVEVNIGAEMYPELDYRRYSIGVGYHFPLYAYVAGNEIKTTFAPTIEPCMIDRFDTWGGSFSDKNNSSHLSLALNLGFQWEVNDFIYIGYSINILPRTDLKAKFPADMWNEDFKVGGTPATVSNFVKIIFKLKR